MQPLGCVALWNTWNAMGYRKLRGFPGAGGGRRRGTFDLVFSLDKTAWQNHSPATRPLSGLHLKRPSTGRTE